MSIRALITSAAVPPGTLTLEAWDALRSVPLIVAADAHDPTTVAVREAGLPVDTTPEPPGDELLERLSGRGDDVVWLAPRGLPAPHELEALTGSAEPRGAALVRLESVMRRLRSQCPWDAEQTHDSLATYLLEEAYEVLETLDDGDVDALREELGDLLLQVYFHAEIEAEAGAWSIDDVADGLIDKLVHRHPHVFADVAVRDAADVEANWDRLKAAEKPRASVLDGVPATLPALAYADKVLDRLRRAYGDVRPGCAEGTADAEDSEASVGRRLLELVVEARTGGVDAEQALRRATRDLARGVEA